ncbi:MAG: chorismate mutase [Ruminococcaceae bacterium]|nr:chorismate mutase [Oscillospiraceae bacterium]
MLNRLRKEIDEIDTQLLALFERRMDVSKQVGAYKKERNLPVLVPEREQMVIKSRMEATNNPAYKDLVADFFNDVMTLSRRLQQQNMPVVPKSVPQTEILRAGYLGRPGSYSEEALYDLFPNTKEAIPADSFSAVLNLLTENKVDVCVLPVENTSTGNIEDVMDLVHSHGWYITAETTVSIRHALAAPTGAALADIRQIYSHPQGFLQCADFLGTLENIEKIPLASTADSALSVSESGDVTKAAIVSPRGAKLYGLTVLKENIQSVNTNTTRFIAVSKNMTAPSEADVVSIVFTLPHESGSLYEALSIFSKNSLNIIYIQSRPYPGRQFEYRFFVDFAGHVDDPNVQKTLEELRDHTVEMRVLGCYPSAREH